MSRSVTLALILPFAVAAGVVALPACTDECERASDCLRGEVCYIGVCTPGSQSEALCQSDSDCNSVPTGGNFRCIAGRCVVRDDSFEEVCDIPPVCFDTNNQVESTARPQTLTATVGNDRDDRGIAMAQPLALRAANSNTVRIIAQNGITGRWLCISLNISDNSCQRIQVATEDPTLDTADIYEIPTGAMCSAMLTTDSPGDIVGEASGTVRNCGGAQFGVQAAFDLTIQ